MAVLSDQTRSRLVEELASLEAERTRLLELAATTEGRDYADQAERTLREFDIEQVAVRIRRIRDRIDHSDHSSETTHDGTVREGEVVVIDFGDGEPERYVVGALTDVDDDVAALTPSSPLGKALLGAVAGSTVSYKTPSGDRSVQVVAVGEADTALAS